MNFKKIKHLFLILISFSCLDTLGQDNLDNLVSQIKMECEKIHRESKILKVIEEDIEGLSSEGGVLKKFMDNKTIRLAELTLFGEIGQSTTEYYFLNGELIFVNKKTEKYKQPIYMGKTETASLEKDEMYFKNQILVRWFDTEGMLVDQVKYLEKQIDILNKLKIINEPGSSDK